GHGSVEGQGQWGEVSEWARIERMCPPPLGRDGGGSVFALHRHGVAWGPGLRSGAAGSSEQTVVARLEHVAVAAVARDWVRAVGMVVPTAGMSGVAPVGPGLGGQAVVFAAWVQQSREEGERAAAGSGVGKATAQPRVAQPQDARQAPNPGIPAAHSEFKKHVDRLICPVAINMYSPSAINLYKFLQTLPTVHKMAYKETPLPRALEHDFWPDVLEVVNHPKVAHLVGMGKVYVALEDTSPKAMTKLFNAAKDATIPGHSPDQLLAAGGLCLEAGDFLFSRDMHGPHDPMDDLTQAKDDLLGPKEDRTASPAVQQGDNTWSGGVQWERSDLTTPVTGSKHSYTLGTTHQIQCKVANPAKGAKIFLDGLTWHHKLRKCALQASIKVGIKCLEWGTSDMALNLKCNAEVHNVQPIGCDDASGIVNYVFPTVQINISSTKKLDDDALQSFQQDLGQFGSVHTDHNNSQAGLTCMINHPDLEDGDQAGVFVLMELGFFVKQDSLTLAVFSGLHWHIGSPPTSATPSPSSMAVLKGNTGSSCTAQALKN
ncbi:hypothetical protein POSPLADRAFT_1147888, partial [Postia placenta MAD-698-R-SB12]